MPRDVCCRTRNDGGDADLGAARAVHPSGDSGACDPRGTSVCVCVRNFCCSLLTSRGRAAVRAAYGMGVGRRCAAGRSVHPGAGAQTHLHDPGVARTNSSAFFLVCVCVRVAVCRE